MSGNVWVLLFSLGSLKILAKRLEVVLLPLELSGGVDFAGTDLGYGHLHIVHPLHHFGVPAAQRIEESPEPETSLPSIIDLLDEGIVLLPECHLVLTHTPATSYCPKPREASQN